jgi:hypothetical protein
MGKGRRVVMKKQWGLLSFILLIIALSPFYLAMYFKFFADFLFPISITSFFASLVVAFLSENGKWKKVTFTSLGIITILVVAFYGSMAIFWTENP